MWPPARGMDEDGDEAPLTLDPEGYEHGHLNEFWGDRASRADCPERVVAKMPLVDLETFPPAEAREPLVAHDAIMGVLRMWMNKLFKWRRSFRETRNEWISKVINGHVPWGALWLKEIRGLAWDERFPDVIGQSLEHCKVIFERFLAQGGDSWDNELWSFTHGPRARAIPLCQLLVTVDAWIQRVGGFRLAGVPDSVACWGSDPGSK
jgi:hypothetical protein